MAQQCTAWCDMCPLSPLLQAQGGAGSGRANSLLAPAMAPSTLSRAGRDRQRQRLLLKGDRDSAVPSLVCADSLGASNQDEQSTQSSTWMPVWPRGKGAAKHRAQLPLPPCAV